LDKLNVWERPVNELVELCRWAMKYKPSESDVWHGIAMNRLLCKKSMKFDALEVVVKDDVPPVVFVTHLSVMVFESEVHDMLSDSPKDAVVTVVRRDEFVPVSSRRKMVMPCE